MILPAVSIPTTKLSDVVTFEDGDIFGSARVSMPDADSCIHCGGIRWVRLPGGERIDNPTLALAVWYMGQGYTLRKNEVIASRGGWVSDGHEDEPDGWQYALDTTVCTCAAAQEEKAA